MIISPNDPGSSTSYYVNSMENPTSPFTAELEKQFSPSFNEALLFWLKLGWISLGGSAGQIAIIQQELVDRKKWISNDRFLHAFY